MGSWHAKVPAKRLDWISTAAAGSLQTQPHASPPSTQPSSRQPARGLIAMLLMMEQAPSLARPLTTTLSSAPNTGKHMYKELPPSRYEALITLYNHNYSYTRENSH